MKLFWRIVLFGCCLASFLVSLQIFYHQGIAADELSLSAAQLFGGNRWLLAAWLRMFLLFIASTVSFLQLFFTKNE